MGVTKALNDAKEDDPLQVFQTHGLPAVCSLVLIVLFDEDTGIFFTNYEDLITKMKLQEIIQIFGANVLGCIIIILWCAVFAIPYFVLIKKCFLRGNYSILKLYSQ